MPRDEELREQYEEAKANIRTETRLARSGVECSMCAGCGQVADDDDGTPWKYWADLPPGSDLAVRMGLVKPQTCPGCEGTGQRIMTKDELAEWAHHALTGG